MLILLRVNCAFSPVSAVSRTRLSEFQQPVSRRYTDYLHAVYVQTACCVTKLGKIILKVSNMRAIMAVAVSGKFPVAVLLSD